MIYSAYCINNISPTKTPNKSCTKCKIANAKMPICGLSCNTFFCITTESKYVSISPWIISLYKKRDISLNRSEISPCIAIFLQCI